MREFAPQEDLSIFGDTVDGVPNPLVGHVHPYPTRHHGPIFTQPQFSQPWREAPYAVAPYAGFGTAPTMGTPAEMAHADLQETIDHDIASGAVATMVTPAMVDAMTAAYVAGDRPGLLHFIEVLTPAFYAYTVHLLGARMQQLDAQAGSSLFTHLSTFWAVAITASMAAGAYHGYKRNQSVAWALWWAFMGTLAPIVTPVIAIAQGFGQPQKKEQP